MCNSCTHLKISLNSLGSLPPGGNLSKTGQHLDRNWPHTVPPGWAAEVESGLDLVQEPGEACQPLPNPSDERDPESPA